MERHGAADLSDAALGGSIHLVDGHFVDGYGRNLNLRGFNVSGASKLPTRPNGLSHLTEGFYQHRTVTFVGRPFPIEDASLHFRRLQAWGMPFVRLLVTWESIAHAGPNPSRDLDLEYIAYLRSLIEMMPKYGIKCFVCAHQDVWSRFSGGSGAPGWTFEAAGLDIEAFTATGAAYVHGQDELRRAQAPDSEKEPSGPFVWPSGYQKLAASTLATLFWAGDALAPKVRCRRSSLYGTGETEDVSVQSFLQDSLIEAFGRLADEVADLEAYIGFEPMNEPHRGLVNLHGFHGWNYDTDLHIGYYPSLTQALALGSGYAQSVPYYVKSWPWPTRRSHHSKLDPQGRSAWIGDTSSAGVDHPLGLGQCLWRAHGAWEWDQEHEVPVVLQPDYFDYDHRPGREGKQIEWYRDCYAPFLRRFFERMSRSRKRKESLSFLEPIPNEFLPRWAAGPRDDDPLTSQTPSYAVPTVLAARDRPRNLVYAPHFYDLNVLFSKLHSFMSVNVQGLARGMFVLKALYFGAAGLRKNYRTQIGNIVRYAHASLGPVPIVIGEVGIPFDIHHRQAFLTGNYDKQRELIGTLISAMEDNCVDGFTLWNYNPDNRVEYGDGWNQEDFSIINGDDISVEDGHGHLVKVKPDYRNITHEKNELYQRTRAIDVVIRPYAVKIAGEPLRSDWDHPTLRYEFEWQARSPGEGDVGSKSRVTEIFVPKYHYEGHQVRVVVSDGLEWTLNTELQTLYVQQGDGGGARRCRVMLDITDSHSHMLKRVQHRRQVFPPPFPFKMVPASVEVWWETFSVSFHMLIVVTTTILILAAALYSA